MTGPHGVAPQPVGASDGAGYRLDFADEFAGPDLDRTRWLPAYLPQWSSRERAAARYRLDGGHLHLLITEDQQPWCPELDGATKVSSLQTGVFSGEVGSAVGQHRFTPRAVVREAQPPQRLYTPQYGWFELRARASADPRVMVAFWLIGYEDRPDRSGEICVCEIFGRDVRRDRAGVGVGVHPFGDPDLQDDFARISVDLDATDFHVYAAEWTPDAVTFLVDGQPVKLVEQSPAYPMQLMLGIYEFAEAAGDRPAPDGRPPAGAPAGPRKEFVVDYVRVFTRSGIHP